MEALHGSLGLHGMALHSPKVSWELSLEVFWWVTACIRQMGWVMCWLHLLKKQRLLGL